LRTSGHAQDACGLWCRRTVEPFRGVHGARSVAAACPWGLATQPRQLRLTLHGFPECKPRKVRACPPCRRSPNVRTGRRALTAAESDMNLALRQTTNRGAVLQMRGASYAGVRQGCHMQRQHAGKHGTVWYTQPASICCSRRSSDSGGKEQLHTCWSSKLAALLSAEESDCRRSQCTQRQSDSPSRALNWS